MRSRTMLLLLAGALVAAVGQSSHADTWTVIATGHISAPSDGHPGPERIQFVAEGCQVSNPSGVFEALINTKPYKGMRLRISQTKTGSGPPSPGWLAVRSDDGCDLRTALSSEGFQEAQGELGVAGDYLIVISRSRADMYYKLEVGTNVA